MLDFIFASSNAHKALELNKIAQGKNLNFLAAPEKIEVEEDGNTYTQNAFIKAAAYFQKYKRPVVADDSGLNIEALPGELGIHTARFGGAIPQHERNALVLQKLDDVRNRQASFTCVLCFYLSATEVFFFEGQLKGSIADKQSGSEGFGYDPIFCPEGQNGQSLAALGEWKDRHSHRAKALESAMTFFKNFKER